MQTLEQYLKSLSKPDLKFVLERMALNGGGPAMNSAKASGECSGQGSTLNGHWEKRDGKCVWIPEIG